jgi:anti-anti-sigma factor
MNIERRTVGDVLVLSIRGDITMNDSGASRVADRVRSAVQEGHTRLVLDLGHVRYVDSAGLGDLVQAYTAARNRGGTVKLINVTKRLHDLLAVTKLLPVFDRFDQESDALASFEQDAGRQPRQVLRCA